MLLLLLKAIYFSNSSPYKKQNPNIVEMLQKDNILPLPYYFPQKGFFEKLEKEFYKNGKWKNFNHEEWKKFFIKNLDEDTKQFLIRKCNTTKGYKQIDNIQNIQHLKKSSLKQFYDALTLESGSIVYVRSLKDSKFGGHLIRIKSELIESKKDDGSGSSIVMCRRIEYLKKVSNETYTNMFSPNNPQGFANIIAFGKMNDKQRDYYIENEITK